MCVRCYGYYYERSQGPEKDSGMFVLRSALVFEFVAPLTDLHPHIQYINLYQLTHSIPDIDTDIIEDNIKPRLCFRSKKEKKRKRERQRTLDGRQCFLSAMLSPHCFNIDTQTHTDTQHTMMKSLSEIRLTSSVYLTSFEEARVQTHTHTHCATATCPVFHLQKRKKKQHNKHEMNPTLYLESPRNTHIMQLLFQSSVCAFVFIVIVI